MPEKMTKAEAIAFIDEEIGGMLRSLSDPAAVTFAEFVIDILHGLTCYNIDLRERVEALEMKSVRH